MELKDLKTGMVVEIRDGRRYIFMGDRTMINENEWLLLENYDDFPRISKDDKDDFDIIKIYKISLSFTLNKLYNNKYLELICEYE